MSKPVKELILADYKKRFDNVEAALVIDVRGMDANDNNALRLDLASKDIRVTIVKNSLARKAFAGTSLEAIIGSLQGPSALAYGAESVVDVAREMVAWARKLEHLELRAAVLDGELFEGKAGVTRLSQYPTRLEAKARVVQVVLAPAATLVAAMLGPPSGILSIVKEIERRLYDEEPISKAG
ncbi:MAG: 50S ribosomal protein L10 [Planctomycetota bacterium]|nr:50S ribosomal protein L10 [Planctomycetota bacterium]MCZ6850172.1 50S ribosomal protein L10 [Planctomycetota bacterium]